MNYINDSDKKNNIQLNNSIIELNKIHDIINNNII